MTGEVEALKQQLYTDRNEFKTHLEEAERTIKNLEARLAELLEVDEAHQKLNGKMQMRITELEQENLELHAENKKISHQTENRVNQLRKSGL